MITKDHFTILIVDDDPQIVEVIQSFLTMHPLTIDCVSAGDTQTASLKISNQDFDLIIIDFRLPGRSGIELVSHLKKSYKFSKIPIIPEIPIIPKKIQIASQQSFGCFIFYSPLHGGMISRS